MADDSLLLAFLADRDVACPVCRYNLRGLKGALCPECSAPLRLDVASPSLRLGPYLFTIVSFALGAGFDLVMTTILGILTVGQLVNYAPPAVFIRTFVVFSMLGSAGLLCLGMIVLLVHEKSRWNRLRLSRQWALGAAVFVMVGLGHLGLGFLISRIL